MSDNQGKVDTHQVVDGVNDPPDVNHRKMAIRKMIKTYKQIGLTNVEMPMNVKRVEKKMYEKCMSERKTKKQYDYFVRGTVKIVKQKMQELAKMNAGQQAPPGHGTETEPDEGIDVADELIDAVLGLHI